ncbi:MAG: hypothetical protein QXT34_01575 [Candidatus Aenigmatarchaeota archaeon]
MVNKRFQKFLFLLLAIVTFLSFTILPVFSDTNDKNIFSAIYYLGILTGVFCIIGGVFGIIKKAVKYGILGIIVGIIVIGIFSYANAVLIGIGFSNFFALGFLVAISSGCLYFLGYVSAKTRNIVKYSKYFFDASAIVAFIGIFIVELLIFSQYVNISKLPIVECKGDVSFFEVQRFFFCIFLGSELSGEQPFWMWISFFIFGFIIPFVLMFSLVYGLFFGMGLHQLFGRYGKEVVGVIAFVTALFGARQLIGVFLIDLLAYGVWGIFGVMISFIITSMIRFTGRMFLKDIRELTESVYGEFVVSHFVGLNQIKQQLDNFSAAIRNPEVPTEFLKAAAGSLDNIIATLSGFTKESDPRISIYANQLLLQASELRKIVQKILDERSGQKV